MKILPAKLPFGSGGILLAGFGVAAIGILSEPIGLLNEINALGVYGEQTLRWRCLAPRPEADWELAALVGIIFGAGLYSCLSGNFQRELFYSDTGSTSLAGKFWASAWRGILGGLLVMAGIRISGDSVWGHFNGAIQMSTGSWLFLGALAVGGVFTALLGAPASTPAGAEKASPAPKSKRGRK